MKSFSGRFYFIAGLMTLYVVAIVWQAMHIIVTDGEHYRRRIAELKVDSVAIAPMRGFIFADRGEMLAGSLPEYDVKLDFRSTTRRDAATGRMNIPPDTIDKYFGPNGAGSRALAEVAPAGGSATEYGQKVRRAYKERRADYTVIRSLPYLAYKRLRTLPYFSKSNYQCGVISEERAHRYRPYGERRMAAATIGDVFSRQKERRVVEGDTVTYVGLGRSGLELACDSVLRGKPGVGIRQKVRRRSIVVTQVPAVNGANVHTTIDVEIQEILDRALGRRIVELGAVGGWGAVMEVKTGKIKAVSNLRRVTPTECIEDYNHLMNDLVDPGSTFKTVSYMILLDEGKVTPDLVIDTRNTRAQPGAFSYRGRKITDDHPVGVVTADEAICQSSNIAVAMMTTQAYESKPQEFLDAVYRTQIFDDLHLDGEFPNAQAPRKRNTGERTWSGVSLAQMSYGYESQIPGLYILNFYNAIANGGRLMRPYIVERIEKEGQTIFEQSPVVINDAICKRATLRAVRHALEGVVDHGTAAGQPGVPGAKSDKVRIAGKTGTAQRYERGGYDAANGHNVSFAGYFPAEAPQYSLFIVINTRPGGNHGRPGGGYMAGPVAKTLAEELSALHCPRQVKDIVRDTLHPYFPTVKGGIVADVDYALSSLGFDARRGEARRKEYAAAVLHVTDSTRARGRFDMERVALRKGAVPDVRGMGAVDALYLLEQQGLRVTIAGRGRVVTQSPSPGSPCRRGDRVRITLK